MSAGQLMTGYYSRNETTKYRYQEPRAEYGESDTVTVEMVIKVPQRQEVRYLCGFWQVVKFAWCQYLLVGLFWYCALYRGFFGYLVTNKVFECV